MEWNWIELYYPSIQINSDRHEWEPLLDVWQSFLGVTTQCNVTFTSKFLPKPVLFIKKSLQWIFHPTLLQQFYQFCDCTFFRSYVYIFPFFQHCRMIDFHWTGWAGLHRLCHCYQVQRLKVDKTWGFFFSRSLSGLSYQTPWQPTSRCWLAISSELCLFVSSTTAGVGTWRPDLWVTPSDCSVTKITQRALFIYHWQ